MDNTRFNATARRLAVMLPRRGVFQRCLIALGAGLAFGASDIDAKKKRKRKKKNRALEGAPSSIVQSPPPPPPTCQESCPPTCVNCFTRTNGPLLCGDGPLAYDFQLPCSSDNDCVGGDKPYCVIQRETRATGNSEPIGDGGFGYCGSFPAC